MKKISSCLILALVSFVSMAQTVVEPPAPVQESGGSSAWIKIALAVGAIAVMALVFYLLKNFNKKK